MSRIIAYEEKAQIAADETHPNQYGREAIAKIIYAWMQEMGWV